MWKVVSASIILDNRAQRVGYLPLQEAGGAQLDHLATAPLFYFLRRTGKGKLKIYWRGAGRESPTMAIERHEASLGC